MPGCRKNPFRVKSMRARATFPNYLVSVYGYSGKIQIKELFHKDVHHRFPTDK
jgi:hypothetical protein